MPEEQKPHCAALRAMNSFCRAASSPLSLSPSMVRRIFRRSAPQGEAAAGRPAVEQNRAGAADAVLAAKVRSGQLELLAQEIRQMQARLHASAEGLSVQRRVDLDLFVADEASSAVLAERLLSTRRVSTWAM